MKRVTLKIESGYTSESISLDEELTIGRAEPSDLVLDDAGLSKINTTIFRDGDDILIVDENSTNGTFLNGERIGSRPKILFDDDEIKLGSETRVSIRFGEEGISVDRQIEETPPSRKLSRISPAAGTVQNIPDRNTDRPKEKPMILLVAAGSTMAILLLAGLGIILVNYFGLDTADDGKPPPKKANLRKTIPRMVIDPFGGKEQEDLAELTQYFEVQEKEIKVDDLEEIAGSTTTGVPGTPNQPLFNYNVSIEFFKDQYALTRKRVWGDPGIATPRELCCGVPKQTAKIREMKQRGYELPMDFADLARKRMAGTLIELPMATDYWVLDVGGSSTKAPFTSFEFETGETPVQPGSADYNDLQRLASNFSGVRYDLNNPTHRRQMKIR
ncbi:MAG: FHA domain-containing protein, partial [Pyrinomonadaceae bacterium]|nr:FHA domain-containing protein [Pyrinomonadaceae bacterium]